MFIHLKKIIFRRKLKCLKKIGMKCNIHHSTLLSAPEKIEIDSYVHIQPHCQLYGDGGGIQVGEGTIFAHGVQILTRNHNYDSLDLKSIPYDERYIELPVKIGKFCWIGANSIILPGVKIEDGVVIGAGAVVTKNVPQGAVIGGNPAKILKYRNLEVYNKLKEENKGYIKMKELSRRGNV